MKLSSKILLPILAVVLLVAGGSAVYFYGGYVKARKEVASLKENPQQAAQESTQDLIAEVAKLIVLPTDEMPTVATVSDLSRLKNQPFFAHATVGDKVLIYTKAKKAILYNPPSGKIIEVAPLNLGDTQASSL